MLIHNRTVPLLIAGCAAALTCLAAGAGLANLDLYRTSTPPHLIPGTVSQDIGAVAVALALLVLSSGIARGNDRLWLLWLGGLGYLAYGYAIFVFEAVLNPFYPVYLGIFALSIWGIMAFFAELRPAALVAIAPPRRLTAVLFFALAGLFVALWSAILIPAIGVRTRPDGLTIFILDLTFVLPLLVLTGVLLWRRKRIADVLAIPLLMKAGSIGLSVLLGTLLSPAFGMPIMASEVAIYTLLGFGPVVLIVPWMRSIRIEKVEDAGAE